MLYIIIPLLLVSVTINIFLFISLKRAFDTIDLLETWIVDFRTSINNVYKKLKEVDNRGIFEKDDDVGFLFNDINNIIKITNQRINDESDNSTTIDEKNNQI